jgi:hypothetical protein
VAIGFRPPSCINVKKLSASQDEPGQRVIFGKQHHLNGDTRAPQGSVPRCWRHILLVVNAPLIYRKARFRQARSLL